MSSLHGGRRLLIPLTVILVLCLAATVGSTSSSFLDTESSGDNINRVITNWYDLAWGYRQPITLYNNNSALTDYQVKVTLDTQSLITAGKMQPDGDDIRFAQSDGQTEMLYWIESGIDTASTAIWVKVPSISGGESTIYVYYGNAGAGGASSLEGTFAAGSFEDLFADGSKVDWSASENATVSGGQVDLVISMSELEDQIQAAGTVGQNVYDSTWSAQTFFAGFTGTLNKVTIKVAKAGTPPNPLEVQLRDAVGDLPGTNVYATASKNPEDIGSSAVEHEFIFATPPGITANTKYALVFKTVAGSNKDCYEVQYTTADVYSNGRKCDSYDTGGSWAGVDSDIYIKTHVNTSWDLDQSQTGSSGIRQVYGDNWRAQSFLAELSGRLKQISLDMARVGTPPNAVTVEVRDVEEVSGEILDQSQTSFSGDIPVYGSNWEGQTFRAGSTGDLTKITLRAAETGSTPNALNVELRDVVTAYQDTLDQSQTSFSGDRQIYADNWRGQIFQAGLDGDLGKVVLRAAKTGTPAAALTVELRDAAEVQEEYLDQTQATQAADQRVYDNTWVAQTFIPGMDGTLTKVTILTYKTKSPPNALELELRNATVDDLPGTTIYASASRSDIGTTAAEYDFVFSTPAAVTAGVKYSIVIKTMGGSNANRYNVSYNTADVYAGGRQCVSWDAGGSWTGQTGDLYFKTYVSQPDYVPGSTVYASASRSDIAAAGEYDFTFGTPPGISSGTKYALVAYTSGGDAANCYSLSYEATDAYANGRECLSSNAGTDWSGSPTDLYFKTYTTALVGDEPGTIVYASASRSDIAAASEYDFTFGSPYTVTAETNYALVIYTTGGDAANRYDVSWETSDVYVLGKEASSADGGANWTPNDAADLYFKTYVTVATGYEPGSVVYATATRSIFVAVSEKVEFFFTSSFTLSAGTRYCLLVNTTGGDASNYYSVSYQGTDVYANGNESYSVDAGASWSTTGNDLWFKIYVDEPNTGTLRSVTIPEDSATRFAVGVQMSWNDSEPVGTDIVYQLEYYSGSGWSLVPDGDLPGNSTGFDDSPVDVSSVLTDYGQTRLRAGLSTLEGTVVPGIQDWTITYRYREYASPEPLVSSIGEEE